MKKYFMFFLIGLLTCVICILLFDQSLRANDFLCKNKLHARQDKDSTVEDALSLKLPVTNTIISEEARIFDEQAIQQIHEGNYEAAINITVSGLNRFPKNFTLQADLAGLLGDCAEITPSPLKEKMLERSKQLFEKLMGEVAGQPKSDVYDFKNEYYYRFAMYREQYELGCLRIVDYWGTDEWERAKGFRGYYSQGVGASNYARKLLEAGSKLQAIDYAQRALVAWAQYFTHNNSYYNAYVHYALALGILGYKEEMMLALNRSASIITQDLNYYEFKEVIDFVEKYQNNMDQNGPVEKFIKSNRTHVKKNSSTCEVAEYIFNQPNLGIAHAKINGRYPIEQNKKAVNKGCDIIYFVLEGNGTVHTENGDFELKKHDAVFLTCGEWYWVDGNKVEVLVISNPEWMAEQYKEI